MSRSQSGDIKNKCVITGVKFEDLQNCPTEDYVISLAISAGLKIDESDIVSVSLQQPKVPRNDSSLIFVVFKTYEMKQKFLVSKPLFPRHLNVKEAMSKETLGLFNCAKSLRRCGYKIVYHNNGNVFVKKSNDHPAIHITNFNKIKELRSSSKSDSLSAPFNELLLL